jgi:2-C-methyl-D-erythritol 4-phosphate cytidylyltransferase
VQKHDGTSIRDVAAILVAGGSSVRFGKPKQFELLGGLPLYQYVARTFSLIESIGFIVVVGRQEDLSTIEAGMHELNLAVKCQVVAGGETRQQSVGHGLRAVHDDPDIKIVLAHDIARPLVDDVVILSVIGAVREFGSAVPAIEIVDTVKRVVGGDIVETVSRENLWRAQTPQGAKIELLRAAYAAARDTEFQATDESQLLERIGEQPHLVHGSNMNFKITYPIDLDRARLAVEHSAKNRK